MRRRLLLALTCLTLSSQGAAASAQEAPPPPSPASPGAIVSTFFNDGNYIGVEVEEITRENAARYGLTGEPRGVGVVRVLKNGPAERAGLKERDVIVRFDGETVTNVRKLNRLVDESAPEHAARLTVLRNGSEQEVNVTLGKREGMIPTFRGELLQPDQMEELRRHGEELGRQGELLRRRGEEMGRNQEEIRKRAEEMRKRFGEMERDHPGLYGLVGGSRRRIGVSTSPVGKQLAEFFGVPQGAGVLVNRVEDDSPAARAGIKAGDVIVEADGEAVRNVGDLTRALGRKTEGEVTLNVIRDKKQRTIRVTPERAPSPTFNIAPGAFTIPPVALTAPRVLTAPRSLTTPRPAPLVRIAPLAGRRII